MIDLQQKIDFNVKNSYWNNNTCNINSTNNINCDLNNKNILCVIKKLGI